jgi:hypothetical protein
VQALGYGTAATPQGLIARVRESCIGEAATIAARTFGGPKGAIVRNADSPTRTCLSRAASTAVKLIRREARARAACIAKAHGRQKPCDVADTNSKIMAAETSGRNALDTACPALETSIGMDAATYVARAATQARCVTATSHGRTDPLVLDCGPRDDVPLPDQGAWTQIILDAATYGSRCGDGTPYAFWLRLPPSGATSTDVVVNLQGGGGCYFAADCAATPAGLFNAMEPVWDEPPTSGILSTDPAENPFADWTMVFLPYCTQDLHLGGGTTQAFPGRTVQRFGAINVRAALRYVRDVLWQRLGSNDPMGYQPDRLKVLFAGMSAGGFGVNGNYHYVLDDLRWMHTTAVPDSSLGLVDEPVLGVLGPMLQADWDTRPYQPPYCLDWSCAVGPVLQMATSARLAAVPEQQILNLSNQVDTEQAATTFHGTVDWINALRAAYCQTRGLTGLHYWLPAMSTPLHVFLDEPHFSPDVTAGGETLESFLTGAIAAPDAVTDHVDEGTLVADYLGVAPIACLP